MNFLYYESKFKFFFWGGGGGVGGARVSDFFFHKESKSEEKKIEGLGRVGVGGVDEWIVEQAQTNLPLQLLRSWGHNNALMYKLCP